MLEKYSNFDKMYGELERAGYGNARHYHTFEAYEKYLSSTKADYSDFIRIVTNWMPKLENRIGGIRLLVATNQTYDGAIVEQAFERANADERWFICAYIARNPPKNAESWMRRLYLSPDCNYGETGLLPLVIIKMFDKPEALKLLRQGFDLHPEVTPEAIGKIGTAEEIPFLEEKRKLTFEKKFIYKEIDKAIKRLKKKYQLI